MNVLMYYLFDIISTMNIFISGINQGCGKTMIAAGITAVLQSLGYKTGVYKPIQTNSIDKGSYIISPDLNFVNILDPHIITHATYLLTSNASPFVASEVENVSICIDDIQNDYNILIKNTDILITEGIGGLLTPIKEDFYNINIPLALNLPVVFVVNPSNDSLNNCLNELITADKYALNVVGIIINKYPASSNSLEINSFTKILKQFSNAKILGIIRNFDGEFVKTDELFTEILNGINLREVLKMEIPKLNV